ncbi:hypothetical protein MTO96_021052 [Rhipicephalus appendiculatus]
MGRGNPRAGWTSTAGLLSRTTRIALKRWWPRLLSGSAQSTRYTCVAVQPQKLHHSCDLEARRRAIKPLPPWNQGATGNRDAIRLHSRVSRGVLRVMSQREAFRMPWTSEGSVEHGPPLVPSLIPQSRSWPGPLLHTMI